MELTENKAAKLKAEIELQKSDIEDLLSGINRCTERLQRFIELRGPMPIIKREVEMIQYRALSVLSMYEALALLDFVYKKEENEQSNLCDKP